MMLIAVANVELASLAQLFFSGKPPFISDDRYRASSLICYSNIGGRFWVRSRALSSWRIM
jgi:hypothetical protein